MQQFVPVLMLVNVWVTVWLPHILLRVRILK
jgi:hypothetical protein